MAQDTLGPLGKLLVEVCLLGFLVGTCVAYFVVIGDLGPSIVSDVFGIENTPHLRAFTMTFIGMFIALPLGLLRRVDSLSSFSILSFGLYIFLVMKLFSEATIKFLSDNDSSAIPSFSGDSALKIASRVPSLVWWDSSGILTNIPIFAMALSCQTQLFELFDHSLLSFEDFNGVHRLNRIVRRAVHLCSGIYITVGLFGYLAFHDQGFGGNILSFLPASLGSTIAKMGFVATVAVSLPLCPFPARTSLYSLFVKKSMMTVDINASRTSLLNDFTISTTPTASSTHMTDRQFRFLTIVLVVFTVSLSIVVPHIEFVLSVIGSTTGTTICFILPGMIYTSLAEKDTTEKLLAKGLTGIGIFILIVCTFSTLNAGQDYHVHVTNEQVAAAVHPKFVQEIFQHKLGEAGSGSGDDSHQKAIDDAIKKVKEKTSKDSIETMQLNKKQEELLAKLEEQQKEQKHLIQEQKEFLKEIKKHEEAAAHLPFKSANETSLVKDSKNNPSQNISKFIDNELRVKDKNASVSRHSESGSPTKKIVIPSMKGSRKRISSSLTPKEKAKFVKTINETNDIKREDLNNHDKSGLNMKSKESQSGDFK